MEERKEEGEAEIQEHGPEHWFSKWERQCLAEAEQDEQLPPELQEEAAAAAQPEHKQQKLWHLFQNSATAVAQLYKGEGRRRHLAAAAAASGPTLGREPRGGLPGSGRRPAAPPHKMAARDQVLGGRPWEGPGLARGRRPSGGRPGGPVSSSGPAAGRPRAGEESPVTKWRREAAGPAPLCPERASGRGLRKGRLPAPRLGPGPSLRASRLPLPPRSDPLPAFLPLAVGFPKPLNKMAKPNMAVPERLTPK